MESVDGGWIGRTLAGRYTVTRRIGSGGMSTVYEATDEQLGRKVAVKLFTAGEARDDSRRRSEVDVLARLNHPQLVTMYDAHLASGDETVPSFLVMELVDGPDLRSTLDHGPLRGAVAAQVATDIAQGLAAMHAQGIVHRDLKPANILLAPTGLPSPTHRAKLADFGIAHLVGADRMTTVGTIIGTASYLSPEQAAGAEPGPEADVYALGLVILEGLSGRREYPGTVVEAMSARASRDPIIAGGIPPSWVSLLTWMTARDPLARPTALDVAVRSNDIARDLADWDGAGGGATGGGADDSTAPLEPPTVVLPAAVSVPGSAASDPFEPVGRNRRGRRIAVVAMAGAAALAGALWLGGSLLSGTPTADPGQPAPVPTETGVPATGAPATDDPGTVPVGVDPVSTQTGDDSPSGQDGSTGTVSPSVPPTASPTAPGVPGVGAVTPPPVDAVVPAPTGGAGPGNNGNGNGNNGNGNGNNGNGNGNNGNGNGNGGNKKG